jgi:hypothetical protein
MFARCPWIADLLLHLNFSTRSRLWWSVKGYAEQGKAIEGCLSLQSLLPPLPTPMLLCLLIINLHVAVLW